MDDLRLLIKMSGIPVWKIAEKIGISEPTIYRWLRTYDAEHRTRILNAIHQIEGEQGESEMHLGCVPTEILEAELKRRLNNETI